MTKEISESLIKQRQLIKEIINPFFKNNGFSRKGGKYIKKLDYFIIEAEIQRQRYYKDEVIENFRINIIAYSENSYKLFYRWMNFGGYSIQGNGSWITTKNDTNIDDLKLWLIAELNKLLPIIEKYIDVDKIIEIEKKSDYQDGINYAFLLKDNNRTEEFKKWLEDKNKKLKKLNDEILSLSQQLELMEKENKANKLIHEIEYNKLWSDRKSKQIEIEFIVSFLTKLESLNI